MGRVHSGAEETALGSPRAKTYYRTAIGRITIGTHAGDLNYDPFMSGRIECNIGSPVQSASFTFHLGKGSKSLSPHLSTGIKQFGSTEPAMRPGTPVDFQTATVEPGTDPNSAWRYVFTGYVDTVEIGGDDTLTIRCRDAFAPMQDRWIDTLSNTDQGYIYGFPIDAARVDIAMQQVLTKAYAGEVVPEIAVRGTPPLAIGAYWQEQMGVLEALRRLGTTTTGWDLRGGWDYPDTDVFRLIYQDPDRSKTLSSVTTINDGRFASGPAYTALKLSTSLVNLRNVCDVIPANDARVPQRVEDAASIAKYGRRFAGLSEDKSSHIDTDPEALALAGIMASDLATPPVDVQVDMNYWWLFELNDLFQVGGDGPPGGPYFSYDANHIFAVSSIVHNFAEGGHPSTTLGGSLAARAAIREWTEGRKRLNQVRLGEPAGPGLPGDIWLQTDDLTIPTVL